MVEHTVKSFCELHKVLERFRGDANWSYRGHTSVAWKLVPKAGRDPYSETDDRQAFKAWRRRAAEFVQPEPRSDWDWLAIAQHHGLATRLLDWSYNPLAAAYFAVEGANTAPAVYALYAPTFVQTESKSPFEVTQISMVRPRTVARRLAGQSGRFTIHPSPSKSIVDALPPSWKIERILIGVEYASDLRAELDFYGVNRLSLFPDLDGLSAHANWIMERREQEQMDELEAEEIR